MSKKSENSLFNLFIIILLFSLINSKPRSKNVLVKADNKINFSCEQDIFYISIEVIFTSKPPKPYYTFTLTLDSPEDLQFKCILEYESSQIKCLHSFSSPEDYIEEGDLFKFPIVFPAIEGISWDYQTFLNEVFRRIYKSKFDCGGEKSEVMNEFTNKIYDLEGSIINIENGICQPARTTFLDYHKYSFDLSVSFTRGDLLNDLGNDTYLLQDIWIPLTTAGKKENDLSVIFAFCSSSDKLTKESSSNFKFNCYIPIELDNIFNDALEINSFFDKVYISKGNEIEPISINLNSKKIEDSLFEDDQGIICPINPVLTIEDKDSIIMGEYNTTKIFSFYIIGTLSNGYYKFKNGTMVELSQTYKDIKFDLIIQDNFINSEEKDVKVSCELPEGTPYDEEGEAIVKCSGKKLDPDNVDIVLNWNLKDNNNLKDIIIKWPKTHDAKRKNLYGYDLRGISIKQSDFGCRDNNFDFYVYIYDLGREPKLKFEMPLFSPKDTMADCKLFDKTTLKCSLNLKHKKIKKGTSIMLPEKGIINVIETMEGNKVNFLTDNFTEINNEKDLFVKAKENCGDNVVVGTLKDMGMSHKTSVVTYILIIVIIFAFIFGFVAYTTIKVRMYYNRGDKLTLHEESKISKTTDAVKK